MLDQRDILENIDKFVYDLFDYALYYRASDIHIEPEENYGRVRLRIDGRLDEILRITRKNYEMLVSKLKLLANMDISEHRRPQDENLKIPAYANVDFRVSVIGTINGEKLVVRILSLGEFKENANLLGFSQKSKQKLEEAMKNRSGMIIFSGPTGSGKSTSLYSLLEELNNDFENIITVEDPVEYNIEGINQININEKIDFTFAKALRSILRQDPDIILIGEIRDYETAQIAIRAAITGHLVLTTLHTNNALSSIIRLKDLGVENYLLSSAINSVASQRLVRKLCSCKIPDKMTDLEYNLAKKYCDIDRSQEIFRANGCPNCNDGYKGREACEEVFTLTDQFRDMIRNGNIDLVSVNEFVKETDFTPMVHNGLQKVFDGVTSFEELINVMYDQI
ncbi:GspE/PulE family protein [Anaerococcus sp. Marseille-Q5996]|uniref:GspE/PulE family protein n=1 Tax=Anaerococcus sp. Marseille-Q5996 TaxID=2972769 RepID=UPI0021C6EFBC|nr:GspE/PulE family protein [Anaerococcus sp. Marseille-Q5996]